MYAISFCLFSLHLSRVYVLHDLKKKYYNSSKLPQESCFSYRSWHISISIWKIYGILNLFINFRLCMTDAACALFMSFSLSFSVLLHFFFSLARSVIVSIRIGGLSWELAFVATKKSGKLMHAINQLSDIFSFNFYPLRKKNWNTSK